MSVWHTELNLNPILDHDVEFYRPKKTNIPTSQSQTIYKTASDVRQKDLHSKIRYRKRV